MLGSKHTGCPLLSPPNFPSLHLLVSLSPPYIPWFLAVKKKKNNNKKTRPNEVPSALSPSLPDMEHLLHLVPTWCRAFDLGTDIAPLRAVCVGLEKTAKLCLKNVSGKEGSHGRGALAGSYGMIV